MDRNVCTLEVGCDLTFNIHLPTPFIFMLRPRSGAHQWVCWERYSINPIAAVSEYTDGFGNLCQRVVAPVGNFSLSVSAELVVPSVIDREPGAPFVEIQYLPDSLLSFLLPSRYCDSELFSQMAVEITAEQRLGYDQVAAIESWVRESIRFEAHDNDSPVAASEVNLRQWGVCRDLSHLAIALCRALCIPARMVVGYLHGLEPMDLHAWFEAYVGGRWYTFDPTQNQARGGYVVLGYGRDAADVAVYNQFGPAVYPEEKTITVTCSDTSRPIKEFPTE